MFNNNVLIIINGIKKSCETMKNLHQIKKSNNNPSFIQYFKNYKKIYRKILLQAKKQSITKKIENSNNKIKCTWNLINKETNKTKEFNDEIILNVEGKSFKEEDAANKLNHYFVNVAQNLLKDINHPLENPIQILSNNITYNNQNMYLWPTNSDETLKCIRSLKNSYASDIYELNSNLIKSCSSNYVDVLVEVFNRCFEDGVFPDNLKSAKVKPIFKKGQRTLPDNYRPISLLPVFSKILEKIIYNRIAAFLDKFKILNPNQFGFRKHKSTMCAIHEFTENVLISLDNKTRATGIFADLSKAFDLVDHNILLRKLDHYGIRGLPLKLIASYLNNRSQRVCFSQPSGRTCSSALLPISHGVPQGSILGPLLFLVYINDLPKFLNPTKSVLYADDTTLLLKHHDPKILKQLISANIIKLNEWFSANKLVLNLSKTHAVNFSMKPLSLTDQTENQVETIEKVNVVKFLGLTLDNNLNWKAHVGGLTSKLSSACHALRQMSSIVEDKTLLLVYNAFFKSHLSYGVMFWGNSTDSDKIFKIQKRAVRIINHSTKYTSCRQIFSKFKILTLYSLYLYDLIRFFKRNSVKYLKNNNFHNYFTRNQDKYCVPMHRLTAMENGVSYAGIKYFNMLPAELREESSYLRFSSKLKSFLLIRVLYSVKEFEELCLECRT